MPPRTRLTFTPFTDDEVRRLLKAAETYEPEVYPLLRLALGTGMRRGELCALKWGDIQFGESRLDPRRHIFVQRSVRKGLVGETKSGKARETQFDSEVWDVLQSWRKRWLELKLQRRWSDEVDWVFPNEHGAPRDSDNLSHREYSRCLKKAKLRHQTFHALRHQFASRCLMHGLPVTFVSKQLGHSSPRITLDVYSHFIQNPEEVLLDRLLIAPVPPKGRQEAQQA